MRSEVLIEALRRDEVVRVVAALDRAGAQPLVFKGAALAHTHYPEPWLRPRLDTDVLVSPARRVQAVEALTALGYEQPPFVSGQHVMHQAPFVRWGPAGLEHVVDLHWRIANVESVARMLSHDDLLARAVCVDAGGHVLRVPAPDDALLLALAHRVAHHADSPELLWLYDIHRLAGSLTPPEWDHVQRVADVHGMRAICARLWVELRTLGPRRGARLLREHLFPPASYMARAYGVRRTWLLPAFYAQRAVVGLARWFAAPPRG
jgi:hypothetical protein